MEKEIIENGSFEGERALFDIHDKKIISSRFPFLAFSTRKI